MIVWEWLRPYVRRRRAENDYFRLMESLRHVCVSRKFTRDEMNAR
jgi:hypothetical protein